MKIRYVIAERPDVPEDWIICNAPRPLNGPALWMGDFIEGRFYAAIDPSGELADWQIMSNTHNDAVQVLYISEEKAIEIARAYYEANYPETFSELDPEEMAPFLRSRGLEILNGGR